MNKKFTRRQRWSFFLMNVASFAIIFLLLGIIIFQLVNRSAYQETDSTLKDTKEHTELIDQEVKRYKEDPTKFPVEQEDETEQPSTPPDVNRFNTQIILWSSEGEILNEAAFGGRISQLSKLRLQTDQLNDVQTITIDDSNEEELTFHSITQKYQDTDGEIAYVQVIANVNQIERSLATVQKIVVGCMVFFWLISIAVSFFLANRSMQPVLRSWKRQQEFVADASHELRTPLTIIQNSLESLFQRPNHTILDESETVAQALNETRRMTTLTTDLLTIARSDSNQLLIKKEKTAANAFLEELVKPFQEMAALEEKDFQLQTHGEKEVFFDRQKIHQVFVILLDNALKYTKEEDKIIVTSEFTHKHWILHFKNTGAPISKEGKKHIFERFYREDEARSKQEGGYGLGLSIALEIITAHEGELTVQDYTSSGVDFVVKLPL